MGNLFDKNDSSNTDVEKDAAELYAELVGEDKKYKTPEELAKALYHSQSHISKLESENAEFRSKVTESKTVEEILKRLNGDGKGNEDKDVSHQDHDAKDTTSPDNIEDLVASMIAKRESERSSKQNLDSVKSKLLETYGNQAYEVWEKAEKESGVDLEALAKQSPTAVFKLIGVSGSSESHSGQSSFASKVSRPNDNNGQRPPAGSKREIDWLLSKGEISKMESFKLRRQYAYDPEKYNA